MGIFMLKVIAEARNIMTPFLTWNHAWFRHPRCPPTVSDDSYNVEDSGENLI